jgi:hypothetical protein
VIYEYAVEPAMVAAWARNRDIGLAPQFGLDQRRVVSGFPTNWEGEVTGALMESFDYDAGDPEYIDAQAYLDGLLSFMKQNMVGRHHRNTNQPWIDQALQEHATEPFHAILASQVIAAHGEIITPDVVHRLHDARWYLPTINVTAKTVEALADHLAPLLRTANNIILVDPYFKPQDPTYRDVLAKLLDRALERRSPSRPPIVLTVMSGVGDRDRPASGVPVADQLRNEADSRCRAAVARLGPCVPVGMSIAFQCIAEFSGGDQVHNRYLLTDLGGACIPYGMQALGENVFDDISPLYVGQYRSRWRQYGKGEGIRIIGNTVTVQGMRV